MTEQTGIQWTDSTWNPWHGCAKVSPGCDHCYMFREKRQYGQDPEKVVRSKTTFDSPLHWVTRPGEVRLVFTCSWSDWFIKDADPWRDEAWAIIKQTPHLTYQILTKRPARIARHLPADWGDGYPNVWLGVSVENQKYADSRIPVLLNVPAQVRFLSCEPLLGPLTFPLPCEGSTFWSGIHWVIVGGESGKDFRTMDAQWARGLRDQCVAAGTPFFFKQYSGVRPKMLGRELDGREWNEFPVGTHAPPEEE